ncbi:hypothetical protein DM860_017914 [Cuscuta australis]|uniref:Uncharacterized protein n=1 Tax=Cuscuta australis TaxID=267555 RepID=A0A328DWH9_9ASTE|nr:hypothetical protein DM860_017914 [Cuscuta australis]
MLISKWTPNFDPNVESPIMPIWISIKNLPIHFHAKESLMQIARIFGNPIKLDSTTENFGRPSIARICVEVDISQPQTNKFFILNREQPVLLEAFYEEVPLFCPECKGISRHKESCTHFKHADSQTKTQARSLDRNIPKGSGKEPVKKQFQQKTDKTPVPSISLSQTSQTIQDKNHHSLPNTDNPSRTPNQPPHFPTNHFITNKQTKNSFSSCPLPLSPCLPQPLTHSPCPQNSNTHIQNPTQPLTHSPSPLELNQNTHNTIQPNPLPEPSPKPAEKSPNSHNPTHSNPLLDPSPTETPFSNHPPTVLIPLTSKNQHSSTPCYPNPQEELLELETFLHKEI